MKLKNFSPPTFGIIIMCFFLPWITFSCQGHDFATFSGVQLMTGTTVKPPQIFNDNANNSVLDNNTNIDNNTETQKSIPGNFFVILAFLSACAGFTLSLIKKDKLSTAAAITAGAGIIFLLSFKSKLDNEILKRGLGILQVNYRIGFYLTLFFFLVAIGINVYPTTQEKVINKNEVKNRF